MAKNDDKLRELLERAEQGILQKKSPWIRKERTAAEIP